MRQKAYPSTPKAFNPDSLILIRIHYNYLIYLATNVISFFESAKNADALIVLNRDFHKIYRIPKIVESKPIRNLTANQNQ